MLNDLSEFAAEWDQLHNVERVSFSLDWDQAMATRWRSLERQYQRGMMTPTQAAKYQDLLQRTKRKLATMLRLKLWVPPFVKKDKASGPNGLS